MADLQVATRPRTPTPYVYYGYGTSQWPRGGYPTAAGVEPALAAPEKSVFGRARKRVNVVSACCSLLGPWVLFGCVFGVLSFSIHYMHPGLCWFLVVCSFLVVVTFGILGWQAYRRRQAGEQTREPTWMIVLFACSIVAWVVGVGLGLYNFHSHMEPHYDMVALNTYANLDVTTSLGTSVMDAGRIAFTAGTYIDTSKAVAFKNVQTYCVAPATHGKLELLTYDFWVVGVNCCGTGDTPSKDFDCGVMTVPPGETLGGDRVLDSADVDLQYFKLATEQAEQRFKINVGHPIFFHSVLDPIGESSTQLEQGVMFYFFWLLLAFGIQLFFTTVVLVMFSRTLM